MGQKKSMARCAVAVCGAKVESERTHHDLCVKLLAKGLRKPDLSLGAKIVAPETVNGLATVLAFVNLTISHSKRDMCLKKRITEVSCFPLHQC